MKVLTLNVWNTSGPYEKRAIRIREWIERLDPDVIGMQEVMRGPGLDMTADLLGGYHTDFAPAQPFWEDAAMQFGNAVGSRWPITGRDVVQLPDLGDDEKRVALCVTIDAPFGPLSFTSTHLNWKLHHGMIRERQVVALCDAVLRRRPRGGFPPVVVGDFNAEPESSEIRYVKGFHAIDGRSVMFYDAGAGAGPTWSNRNPYAAAALEPDRRIDYIFVGYPVRMTEGHGIGKIEHCRVVCDDEKDGVWPSDHFGVYAELRTDALPR